MLAFLFVEELGYCYCIPRIRRWYIILSPQLSPLLSLDQAGSPHLFIHVASPSVYRATSVLNASF